MSQIIEASLQYPSSFHCNCFKWIGLCLFMPNESDTICPFQVNSRLSSQTLIIDLGWDVRVALGAIMMCIKLFNYPRNGTHPSNFQKYPVFFLNSLLVHNIVYASSIPLIFSVPSQVQKPSWVTTLVSKIENLRSFSISTLHVFWCIGFVSSVLAALMFLKFNLQFLPLRILDNYGFQKGNHQINDISLQLRSM